ncbi:MAG: hypothetical protein KJN71_10175 [Acidimicrobiia bacterium]|nr:hypothetical protein [Acidimicrobiia bacterium]
MTTRGRGRPPKYPAEVARARLLEYARRRLHETGSLDEVTLDRTIREADVPHGSAYRLWSDSDETPQQAFRRELSIDVLAAFDRVDFTASDVEPTVAAVSDLLHGADPDQSRWALNQIIRTVANQRFDALREDQEWRVFNSLRADRLAKDGPESDLELTVRRSEQSILEDLAEVFTEVAEATGVRLRAPFTMKQFCESIVALNEGLSSRLSSVEEPDTAVRPTGRHGEMQDWSLLAVGVEALATIYFEVQ